MFHFFFFLVFFLETESCFIVQAGLDFTIHLSNLRPLTLLLAYESTSFLTEALISSSRQHCSLAVPTSLHGFPKLPISYPILLFFCFLVKISYLLLTL